LTFAGLVGLWVASSCSPTAIAIMRLYCAFIFKIALLVEFINVVVVIAAYTVIVVVVVDMLLLQLVINNIAQRTGQFLKALVEEHFVVNCFVAHCFL